MQPAPEQETAKFVSDLAGCDLPRYDGKEEAIVRRVVAWLTVHPEALSGVKPSDVLSKLPRFRAEKAKLKAEWDEVRWWNLVGAASGFLWGRLQLSAPKANVRFFRRMT